MKQFIMGKDKLFLVKDGNPIYKIIVPTGNLRDYEIAAKEELKNE